jgi:hypothetical protein
MIVSCTAIDASPHECAGEFAPSSANFDTPTRIAPSQMLGEGVGHIFGHEEESERGRAPGIEASEVTSTRAINFGGGGFVVGHGEQRV